MSNKHLKEKYNETFNIVEKIVNEWDPMGLFPDAPDDEYEVEIAKIVSLLNKVELVETLSDGIGKIFTNAFERHFTNERCLPIANNIWREI